MITSGAIPGFLNIKIWRIFCEDCQSLRWPKLPFTEGKKRHAKRFTQFAIDLLHYKSPILKNLKHLGTDEFSIRRSHNYMSICVDLESDRILNVGEGKTGKGIQPFPKSTKRKARKHGAIEIKIHSSQPASTNVQDKQQAGRILPAYRIKKYVSVLINRCARIFTIWFYRAGLVFK